MDHAGHPALKPAPLPWGMSLASRSPGSTLDRQCGQRETWPPSLRAAACLSHPTRVPNKCGVMAVTHRVWNWKHFTFSWRDRFQLFLSHKRSCAERFPCAGRLHRPELPWADCWSPGPECDGRGPLLSPRPGVLPALWGARTRPLLVCTRQSHKAAGVGAGPQTTAGFQDSPCV